jgi:hypothetical protein
MLRLLDPVRLEEEKKKIRKKKPVPANKCP